MSPILKGREVRAKSQGSEENNGSEFKRKGGASGDQTHKTRGEKSQEKLFQKSKTSNGKPSQNDDQVIERLTQKNRSVQGKLSQKSEFQEEEKPQLKSGIKEQGLSTQKGRKGQMKMNKGVPKSKEQNITSQIPKETLKPDAKRLPQEKQLATEEIQGTQLWKKETTTNLKTQEGPIKEQKPKGKNIKGLEMQKMNEEPETEEMSPRPVSLKVIQQPIPHISPLQSLGDLPHEMPVVPLSSQEIESMFESLIQNAHHLQSGLGQSSFKWKRTFFW